MIRSDKATVDFSLLVSSVVHAFVVNKLNSSDPPCQISSTFLVFIFYCVN